MQVPGAGALAYSQLAALAGPLAAAGTPGVAPMLDTQALLQAAAAYHQHLSLLQVGRGGGVDLLLVGVTGVVTRVGVTGDDTLRMLQHTAAIRLLPW